MAGGFVKYPDDQCQSYSKILGKPGFGKKKLEKTNSHKNI